MTKKQILYFFAAIVLLALAWFAYYAVSPLFRSVKVDEAAPTDTATPQQSEEATEEMEASAAPVIGTVGHPASGSARIIEAEGTTYIRYEDYKTINGPDLYVYLAKDLGASDFVSLGALRATEGNINYAVPQGVDIAQYPYVLTWCEQFGVLFNSAKIGG